VTEKKHKLKPGATQEKRKKHGISDDGELSPLPAETSPAEVPPADPEQVNTDQPIEDEEDRESAVTLISADEPVEVEKPKEEEEVTFHPPTRDEVLKRLLEKNEIILKLTRENAEKNKQLNELKDKWLRSVAEFENYRKRTRKEWELLKQQSRTEVILEILSIVDDFERAFSAVGGADHTGFVDGVQLIYNSFVDALGRLGVKEIDAHRAPFDPGLHMAVGQLETSEVDSGHVAEVIQKGYLLDDAVIRPARVIVAK